MSRSIAVRNPGFERNRPLFPGRVFEKRILRALFSGYLHMRLRLIKEIVAWRNEKFRSSHRHPPQKKGGVTESDFFPGFMLPPFFSLPTSHTLKHHHGP
ncbi:MAG: hypothetical protein DRH20_05885 [Deltaproteobacteria bacterium]|nr:MAG: hypothetical protein DRH20_05885 [Deltaproteobacteria bacterium]